MSLKRILAGIVALYNKLHQIHKYLLDNVDVKLSSRASEATLQSINSKLPQLTSSGNFPVSISEDNVGLAKDSSVISVSDKLYDSIENKTITTIVKEIRDKQEWNNLNNLDTKLSTRASETSLIKNILINYDFQVRRSGGKLLAVVDFTINKNLYPIDEFDLGYIEIDGGYQYYEIVRLDEEKIPSPEGDGSPYVLKIVVNPQETVHVKVPVKARYFMPFCAYITLYSKDYDIYINPYIVLGGQLSGFRNKFPKSLKLPSNCWGRFVVHWFMEAHHGCAHVVIDIYNPNNVAVTVYIGIITSCELYPHIKGFCMLFGWEGVFELELNNENLNFGIHIMLPTDIKNVVHLYVSTGVKGDGSNPLSVNVKIIPSNVTIISGSNSSTSQQNFDRYLKIFLSRRGVYNFDTFLINVNLSTSGKGSLSRFVIALMSITDEYEYCKNVNTTVSASSTLTIVDYSSDVRHIKGAILNITAPSDGSVDILADTPEGETVIASVPAGKSEMLNIGGRYTYLKVRNNGSSSVTVYGHVIVSESLLIR